MFWTHESTPGLVNDRQCGPNVTTCMIKMCANVNDIPHAVVGQSRITQLCGKWASHGHHNVEKATLWHEKKSEALPTWPTFANEHFATEKVTMSTMASQITSIMIFYSTVYSGADQRKHQSSEALAFVRGIHQWPVNSAHKGPVARTMFPPHISWRHDVIEVCPVDNRVQLAIGQYQLRQWLGTEQATNQYLYQCWLCFITPYGHTA